MAKKLAKSSVDYSRGKPDAHCGICSHYEGNGNCGIVAGVVNPAMWCNHFERRKGAKDMAKKGVKKPKPGKGGY